MRNDKNIKNNNETKICKCCGRELPLSSFAKSGKKYTRKICKSCENKQRREKREDNRFSNGIEQYLSDDSMHIQRQYKKINQDRILRKKISGIDFCAKDEKFVKFMYYKDACAKDKIYEKEDGTFVIGGGKKKTYATLKEAEDIVCERNQNRIESVAEKCKGSIPMCAYEAMLNWDVRLAMCS